MPVAHFLDTTGLSPEAIADILREAATFVSEDGHANASAFGLHQRRVALAFFEPSTRTRLSFEIAAHRLGASTYLFQPETSSVEKGETLQDTLRTLHAMGIHAVVLRHAQDGLHAQLAQVSPISIINAGEGRSAHPTQALLDAATLQERWRSMQGKRISIVGDIRHSRVARSNVDVYTKLGAEVAICAPEALLPDDDVFASCVRHATIDDALAWADAVTMLRIQRERITSAAVPSVMEYRSRFALTADRAAQAAGVLFLHPGPVNIGIEIDAQVLDMPSTLIDRQVTHGVAVRMAVLRRILPTTTTHDHP
jgi:aspartate carbamoyltransferase catalytic subunit